MAFKLGCLDEYYEGDAATIDRLARRWQFYTGLFGLGEMQAPVSGENLARLMGLYR